MARHFMPLRLQTFLASPGLISSIPDTRVENFAVVSPLFVRQDVSAE
jgi:hypothetical protein